MTSFESLIPVNMQRAVWHMALHPAYRASVRPMLDIAKESTVRSVDCWPESRKATSGGPRDRSKHIAYQKTYQSTRRVKGFGVMLPDGNVACYKTRSNADKVRAMLKTWRTFGYATCVCDNCSEVC
jgi:hypothetical protein